MAEEQLMLTVFGQDFSPYAVFTAIGALAGMLVFVLCGRKEKAAGIVLTRTGVRGK